MIIKRYLYRGFHSYKNGETIITFNGEKIHGEWIYWDCFGCSTKQFVRSVQHKKVPVDYILPTDIIPETIGQWVKTDKNGKDLFEGDKVRGYFTDIKSGEITYRAERSCFVVTERPDDSVEYDMDDDRWELIGNIWEETK